MSRPSRFDAPRSLARALAELARRSDPERAREAELRAVLPGVLGPWLHGRLTDVALDGARCRLDMADGRAAAEMQRHVPEILRGLRRRMGAAAPAALTVRTIPAAPRPRRVRDLAPQEERPATVEALRGVVDPRLRARLARWAGVELED